MRPGENPKTRARSLRNASLPLPLWGERGSGSPPRTAFCQGLSPSRAASNGNVPVPLGSPIGDAPAAFSYWASPPVPAGVCRWGFAGGDLHDGSQGTPCQRHLSRWLFASVPSACPQRAGLGGRRAPRAAGTVGAGRPGRYQQLGFAGRGGSTVFFPPGLAAPVGVRCHVHGSR